MTPTSHFSPYLVDLTLRLATAVAALPQEIRVRHATFFRKAQQPDGGFAGREGGSDLYYTSFALRGLAVLGELHGEVAERAAQFLQHRLTTHAPLLDLLSLVYGASLLEMSASLEPFAESRNDWQDVVADTLESLRTADGGYAKGPEGAAGSTYHSFLVAITLQLLQRPLVEPENLARFVREQQRDDGGFVEIRVAQRSGTNPTAAAIGLLRIVDPLREEATLTPSVCEEVAHFLVSLQTTEGGLRANTRIPIADLLSTFTGVLTLADLSQTQGLDLEGARQFVESLEVQSGGFLAAEWDDRADVEYTFYGLAGMALLRASTPKSGTTRLS